jgi:hypothetical protein
MESKVKPVIGIRLLTEGDGFYFHVRAWPQYWDKERNQWDYFSEYTHDPDLHAIVATCQSDREKTCDCQSYAWRVESQSGHVELSQAKRAVKALTPIEKKMDKIAQDFGRPVSFGQYVLHFSRAIGATRLIVKSRFVSDGDETRDIVDVAFHVDRLIQEFLDKYRKTA